VDIPYWNPSEGTPRITFAIGDKQFEVQKEDIDFAKLGNGMQYSGI